MGYRNTYTVSIQRSADKNSLFQKSQLNNVSVTLKAYYHYYLYYYFLTYRSKDPMSFFLSFFLGYLAP